ncbi:MAG: hypothetical protein A2016_08345 [Elusimicrobia bacterium GWF2_62_30]|nr:MAG: hypothetical protein A2016_08345 [Elusimicrobia bacterium GWF2_62_30]
MSANGLTIRVLLVEDNPPDAKIIAELFRDIAEGSFQLTTTDTLRKGVAADAASPADIILLDLNLPDSYGPATLTRAMEQFKDRPIIVLTGFYEEKLGLDLIRKGAQDYLVKGKITGDWLGYSIRYAIQRFIIEQQLRARENRLRSILEKSPDGVLITSQGSKVLFVNPGAEHIFDLTREELLERPFTLEARSDKSVEAELTRHDGRKVPLEIRAVDIAWGNETCKLVILRDLGAMRSLEKTRDEFISMVSHELRSPLTVVKEALQLIYDGTMGEATEQQKELLKIGLDNAGRLNRLIDALLDITKIEAGVMPMELSKASLDSLLKTTLAEYSMLAAERGIKMEILRPGRPVETYCDLEKVREVLVNLVSNALKFTPKGGEIILSLAEVEDQALICVENTGQGIEPENIPRLFTKFSQLSRQAEGIKGTGLGLAISKGFVEMHGGRIWADSRPGKWCRFSFIIPVIGFEQAAKELVRREIEAASKKQARFCSLTVALPKKNGEKAERTASQQEEDFLRNATRSTHGMLRRDSREFTMLLGNAGPKEACRASSYIEKGLAEIAGGGAKKQAAQSFILAYPDDFTDADAFLKKLSEARAGK